jgi:hypothetical protein
MPLMHKHAVMPPLSVTGDDGDEDWEGGRFQEIPGRDEFSSYHRQPGDYAKYATTFWEEWERIAGEYEANPDGFYESYHYLNGHPAFWHFRDYAGDLPADHIDLLEHSDGLRACIDISVVKANPETACIDDDEALNTATRVWFEFGKHGWPPEHDQWHDWTLDDGAETYEGAIVLAARKVWENYGNDRRIVDSPEWGSGDDRAIPVAKA